MGGLRNNGQSDGKVRVVCGYVYMCFGVQEIRVYY